MSNFDLIGFNRQVSEYEKKGLWRECSRKRTNETGADRPLISKTSLNRDISSGYITGNEIGHDRTVQYG